MMKTGLYATLFAGAMLAFVPGCKNDGKQRDTAGQPAGAMSPGAPAADKAPAPPSPDTDKQPVSGSDKDKPAAPGAAGATDTAGTPAGANPDQPKEMGAKGGGTAGKPDAGK